MLCFLIAAYQQGDGQQNGFLSYFLLNIIQTYHFKDDIHRPQLNEFILLLLNLKLTLIHVTGFPELCWLRCGFVLDLHYLPENL